MPKDNQSIFKDFYTPQKFIDRYDKDKTRAVDVIIPVLHTNELWQINLLSIYREVPVHHLLIGDAGVKDNSITIAKKFPRVKVFDHRKYKTLGYSVRKLIEAVDSEWFIYAHSDIYLPRGWFNVMEKNQKKYDWFGCRMMNTLLITYEDPNNFTKKRPFYGSQMGRKAAFVKGLKNIDDDYVYRQEDFVFSNIIESSGFKQGFVDDMFYYHQTMRGGDSKKGRVIRKVTIDTEMSREEEIKTHTLQAHGFVKYLPPNPFYAAWVTSELASLQSLGELDWQQFKSWVKKTNPEWLPYLKLWRIYLVRLWQSPKDLEVLKNKLLRIFFGKK